MHGSKSKKENGLMFPEIIAAIIGATATVLVMTAQNTGNKRESQLIEIYKRLNKIEQDIAAMTPRERNRNWRNR